MIGAREADDIALTRQRETIEHALNQHGLALARELRVQTVWTESYERTLARDTAVRQEVHKTARRQLRLSEFAVGAARCTAGLLPACKLRPRIKPMEE